MRGSNALLVAGVVALVAGLAGPSLAAEESDTDAAAAEVAAAGSEAPAEPAQPAETLPAEPLPAEPPSPGGEGAKATYDAAQKIEADEPRGDRRDEASDGGAAKQPLADRSVTIEDFEYKPDPIEVAPGDEITWTNRDTAQHTATAEGKGDFDTGLLERGETGTVPFNDPGSYAYICTVHPDMRGKVVVRSGGSGGGSGGSSGGSGATSSSTGATTPASPTGSSGATSSSPSTGGGSLPNTGGPELPLLVLGTGLIVIGLLARAFREYWIWR